MNRSRRNAFTLVEMLVVVGILAMLLAILLPVLQKSQMRGRESVCLSNLKQLGAAVALYQNDYDGLYPYALQPDFYERREAMFAGKYLREARAMGNFVTVLYPYTKSNEVYRCPADRAAPPLETTSWFERYGSSYSYDYVPAMLHQGESFYTNPTTTMFMMDLFYWHGGSDVTDGRVNMLFVDRHVKNMSTSDESVTASKLPEDDSF